MEILGKNGTAHKARLVGAIAVLMLAGADAAHAQATPPAGNPVDNAPSEAARRAAMSPYRFIIQNATAPARKPVPKPAEAPAPAVEAKRSAPPAPVQQAAAQPAPAPAPKAVETQAPAPAPVPEPTIAALSRKPAEPPPRREVIPIRTDEPRLSPALLREQPHGTVKIHFDIQPDGSVGEVKVMSSTNRSLNRPTVEAVQGWKFQPVDEILTVETEVVYKLDN